MIFGITGMTMPRPIMSISIVMKMKSRACLLVRTSLKVPPRLQSRRDFRGILQRCLRYPSGGGAFHTGCIAAAPRVMDMDIGCGRIGEEALQKHVQLFALRNVGIDHHPVLR